MNPNFLFYSSLFAGIYTVLGSLAYYTFSGKNLVSGKDAKNMIKNKKIKHVIDVRTEPEFIVGHYPSAIHFPITSMNRKTISQFMKKHNIKKSETLLVYCNTGQRARSAADKLNDAGVKNVVYIAGSYKSIM